MIGDIISMMEHHGVDIIHMIEVIMTGPKIIVSMSGSVIVNMKEMLVKT